MAKFTFCLTIGKDGYMPDEQNYVSADNSVDAYDAIVSAIADFKLFEENDNPRECDWRTFFERGCSYPNASQWNFTLAQTDEGLSLSLVGMTQEDFDRESAEA